MSPSSNTQRSNFSGFPRVSGDEPMQQRELTLEALFSPRERG